MSPLAISFLTRKSRTSTHPFRCSDIGPSVLAPLRGYKKEGEITYSHSAYHTVLAVQTLRARSACSASRADARVWTAARGVIRKMRAISPESKERDDVARDH
jgi:hypothetical protein